MNHTIITYDSYLNPIMSTDHPLPGPHTGCGSTRQPTCRNKTYP
ncbi:hypothetical protein [uncultured Bacteroides sp.]|nr:hypothetical protein [uncultured Bacteroides sp.]